MTNERKEDLKEELKEEQLEEVSGGTFDTNHYTEEQYHKVGIDTNYHFFAKDEFYMTTEGGKKVQITYAEAHV